MKSIAHLVCLVTIVTLASPATRAQWSNTTLTEPRAFPSAATVGDLALFAGGGDQAAFTVSDIVDVYDASTDNWSTATLSEARAVMGVAVLGDLVFFAGGGTPTGVSNVVDVYDASRGPPNDPTTWSTATPLSERRALVAATSVGTKAFFAGGETFDVFLGPIESDVVDIYDSALGLPDDPTAWSTTTLSQARTYLSATTAGSQALFAGGREADSVADPQVFDIVDIYDDDTEAWTTSELSFARPLLYGSATSVGSLAFFAGGQFTASVPFMWSNVVDIYDARTGDWSTTMMSVERSELAVTAVGDTVVFAGGATGATYVPTDVVEFYDVNTGQWGPIAHLSKPRYFMAATSVDGKAFFAGGQKQGGLQAPAWDTIDIYEVGTWTHLGGGTVGVAGTPWLYGTGDLVGGNSASVSLRYAPPSALALAWVSFAPTPFAALGGTVHAYPFASQLNVFTNLEGRFSGATTWPLGIPQGTEVWFQFVMEDVSTLSGITLSNGLYAITP